MCDIMQKDVVLASCTSAIANLSRKEQTPAVSQAEKALAQMHHDLLVKNESDIDFDTTLDKIFAYEAVI